MFRALLLTLAAALSASALAQVYCNPKLKHTAEPLRTVVAQFAQSDAAQEAFFPFWSGREVMVLCTSGAVLEYTEQGVPKTILLAVDVRMARTFQLSSRFYFIVDNGGTSRLDSFKTGEYLARWASSLKFKGAGVLPRVDSVHLASGLGKFRNSNPDEESLITMPLRFEAIPAHTLYLASWRSYPARPSNFAAHANALLFSQGRTTGDVNVASDFNLFEELVLPLRSFIKN